MQQLYSHIPFKMSIAGLKEKRNVECTQWPLSIFQTTRDGNEGLPDDLKLFQ